MKEIIARITDKVFEKQEPDQGWFTPFNIVAGIILIIGAILTVLRFTMGFETVTNLDNNNPWGIWIGFDLLCGVALAAGGYVTSATCYIFGLKRFHSAVRPAILTAFLGYALVGVCPTLRRGAPLASDLSGVLLPGHLIPAL